MDLVSKVMSLLFNMLSSLVIAFLPRNKYLLISGLQSLSAVILEPPKIVFRCFAMKWWDQTPWSLFSECWVLSQLFTLLFHFHQEALQFLLTFCHKGGVIYILRLLMSLVEILIPAQASCSPEFFMMFSSYKLNNQGDNIQPWCTPFPIWNQSILPCPF